jgi:hypothetical protein
MIEVPWDFATGGHVKSDFHDSLKDDTSPPRLIKTWAARRDDTRHIGLLATGKHFYETKRGREWSRVSMVCRTTWSGFQVACMSVRLRWQRLIPSGSPMQLLSARVAALRRLSEAGMHERGYKLKQGYAIMYRTCCKLHGKQTKQGEYTAATRLGRRSLPVAFHFIYAPLGRIKHMALSLCST